MVVLFNKRYIRVVRRGMKSPRKQVPSNKPQQQAGEARTDYNNVQCLGSIYNKSLLNSTAGDLVCGGCIITTPIAITGFQQRIGSRYFHAGQNLVIDVVVIVRLGWQIFVV